MAAKVRLGQRTLSPLETPKTLKDKCKAAVPELSAQASFIPIYLASSDSNKSTFGPNGAIQLESNALIKTFPQFLHMGINIYVYFSYTISKIS